MVMIEMREAAQDRALELLDESKDLQRQLKLVTCELEDALYDCFEGSKEDEEVHEEPTDEGTDLGFKDKYFRHYAMRNFDNDDDMTERQMRQYRRRAMRMRRNRMGRYA